MDPGAAEAAPFSKGPTMRKRTPEELKIIPAHWRFDQGREEYHTVVLGHVFTAWMAGKTDGIENWSATIDQAGKVAHRVDGHHSPQEAANAIVEQFVRWFREDAKTDEILGLVEHRPDGDGKLVQTEIAEALGVSQKSVSQWVSGDREISPAIRQHILTMGGIKRTVDRYWAVTNSS